MDNETLVLDLLGWVGTASRPCDEVIGARRSTCACLSIREDALTAGRVEDAGRQVRLASAGRDFLIRERAPISPD